MDYEKKKKINEKIKQIQDKDIYLNIFNIVKKDLYVDGKKKFSSNSSGIYFDLLNISDQTLNILDSFLNKKIKEINNNNQINFIKYSQNDKVEEIQGKNEGPRLSTQEKNIISKSVK